MAKPKIIISVPSPKDSTNIEYLAVHYPPFLIWPGEEDFFSYNSLTDTWKKFDYAQREFTKVQPYYTDAVKDSIVDASLKKLLDIYTPLVASVAPAPSRLDTLIYSSVFSQNLLPESNVEKSVENHSKEYTTHKVEPVKPKTRAIETKTAPPVLEDYESSRRRYPITLSREPPNVDLTLEIQTVQDTIPERKIEYITSKERVVPGKREIKRLK